MALNPEIIEAFHAALKYVKDEEDTGIQKEIAFNLHKTPSYVSQVMSGEKQLKKKQTQKNFFDAVLSVSHKYGKSYDEFVEFGRTLIGQYSPRKPQFEHPLIVHANDDRAREYIEEHAEHYRGIPL